MYKEYTPKTKRQSKRISRKANSKNHYQIDSRRVQSPISALDPCFASSVAIQRVRFVGHIHGNEERKYKWSPNEMSKINAAIEKAIRHLNAAEMFLRAENNNNMNIIMNAVQRVRNVLTGQEGELAVFPILNDEDSRGMAAKGKLEISISLEQNKSDFDFSKTLIHEAFHIIGGCMPYKKTPTSRRLFDPDDILCGDDVERKTVLAFLLRCKNIVQMSADHFAQFVMKCEQSSSKLYHV